MPVYDCMLLSQTISGPRALSLRGGCRVFGWCRVVSDGVGWCRGGVRWCRGGAVSDGVGGLWGLLVCEDVYALASAVGAVGLSGCRVSGAVGWCRTVGAVSGRAALLCGVRLASRFDPDNSKQSVEESNPNMHTLKYMRLKISLTPRSSVRLRPFKARNWPKKAL